MYTLVNREIIIIIQNTVDWIRFWYVLALIGKGYALDNLGNHTEAVVYYYKALAIDPNNTGALIGKKQSLADKQ